MDNELENQSDLARTVRWHGRCDETLKDCPKKV